jgi:hypothetical protein
MAPPQVGGKADAIATLSGEDIPSDFPIADATYLHDRSIDALAQVGALEGTRLALAQRADGIIDALPADGRLDVEELVRMEESPYFDLLFPEEQDALPTLWPLLEVPDTPTQIVAFAAIDPLEIEDRTIDPGELQLPDWLAIDEFSVGVRDALRRIQLAFDDDGDDDTVSIDDIDDALGNPGAFTPAEIAAIEQAREEFVARGTSLLSAVTGVPRPGNSVDTQTAGAITFDQSVETTIVESRGSTVWSDHHSESYRVDIDIDREVIAGPRLEPGQQLLVIESLQEQDRVLDGQGANLQAGTYLVELWEDGTRQDVLWADLPTLGETSDRLEIDERVGHRLETFEGEPLQSNLREASARTSNWYTQYHARYTWDLGPEEPTGDVDNHAVSTLAIPRTSYPAGRYAVQDEEGNAILLDIFPEGALRATYRGTSAWMHLHSNGSNPQWARRYSATTGDRNVHYQVFDNVLHAWRNFSSGTHYYATIDLLPTDRQG